jgi:hypothetical protein
MKTENSVSRTFGRITVDSVGPSLNPKKHQAQVRQIVTSLYPGARGANSLSDALFADKQFGVGEAFEEVRVTWIPVPIGTTVKQVEAQLAKHPNAVLQRTLSLNPILSEEQEQAMASGLSTKTLDDYREKHIVDAQGNPVLYKGRKQYRNISFRITAVEDVDLRDSDFADFAEVSMTEKSQVKEKF